MFENLQTSIDWYDIQITNAIARYPAQWFVPHCYDPKYNPDFDVSNRYCSYFSRDPETGSIIDAYEINRNIGGMEASGIDFEIDWHAPAGPGQIGVAWLLTWLDTWSYHDDPKSKPTEWIGTGCCPTLPRWKWNLDTSYGVAQVTVHAIWQFLGAFESWNHPGDKASATNYVDLIASYEFDVGGLDGLRLRLGITNLFNQEPPIFAGHGPVNTDPAVFDVLGRRYFVGVSYAVRPGGG
jgi:outer membrane receptor protein involved in Fe transport